MLFIVGVAAQQVPPSCGTVGAPPNPPKPKIPPLVISNKGTVITVTTEDDFVNGNTTSVAALLKNPGPDGISLREAIMATNSDPGVHTITFAPTLKGATIRIGASNNELPSLTAGNVLINGDMDGDGRPDITLTNATNLFWALSVASSGNTISGLSINGFWGGILFTDRSGSRTLYANNTVSNSAISTLQNGIALALGRNYTVLTSTLLEGNVISTKGSAGIYLTAGQGSSADKVTETQIINNTIIAQGENVQPIAAVAGAWSGKGAVVASNNTVSGLVIEDNSISGEFQSAIYIGSGIVGVSHNTVSNVTILGNRISQTPPTMLTSAGFGINIASGDGASDFVNASVRPIVYPGWNIMSGISVVNNTITGIQGDSVFVSAGCCGADHNKITSLKIVGNVISTVTYGLVSAGVLLQGSGDGGFYSRLSRLNNVTQVTILSNSVNMVNRTQNSYSGAIVDGGIVLLGGRVANNDGVSNVQVSRNFVNGSVIGINLVSGLSDRAQYGSTGNSLRSIQLTCNVVPGTPSLVQPLYPGVKGINVAGGVSFSSGQVTSNAVGNTTSENDMVAGVLNDVSFFPNLGSGASGNTVSVTIVPSTSTTTTTSSSSAPSNTSSTSTTTSSSTSPTTTTSSTSTAISSSTLTTTTSISSSSSISVSSSTFTTSSSLSTTTSSIATTSSQAPTTFELVLVGVAAVVLAVLSALVLRRRSPLASRSLGETVDSNP